ncbi:MAG: glycoside hydrolase family 16 protein [Bacteroidia bacterium]
MRRLGTNRLLLFLLAATLVFGLSNCKDDSDLGEPNREYELVWSDEFNGDSGSLVDPTKWTYDLGKGINGWGNGELQSYTKSAENVSQDGNGNLIISALKNSNGTYTSGRIKTQGIFTQEHGRIEARIMTPAGQGVWPAFWLLGENINQVGWPQCGEIDVMEQQGQKPFITHGSLHGPGYSAGNALTADYRLETDRFDDQFYVYAVEWGADYIDFFLNDIKYNTITPAQAPGEWVFNQEFFILLNVAVGGSFVGLPNDNTPFPASMYIDYVRVYKEKQN